MNSESELFIIAHSPATRRELAARVDSLGVTTHPCRSADEFVALRDASRPTCVLWDISRPEEDMELLAALLGEEPPTPLIAIAAEADVPMAVHVMKLGAMDFFQEPCGAEQLTAAIEKALAWAAGHRRLLARNASVRRRLNRLTAQQRSVLDALLAGSSNREIAADLEKSVRCIEERRAKIMKTMHAKSLPDLVRMTLWLESPFAQYHAPGPNGGPKGFGTF